MRLSRLAVCTLASDTPITKIEVSCSGEIRSISFAEVDQSLVVEKTNQLRCPRITDCAVERLAHRHRIRRAAEKTGKFRKQTLRTFQDDGICGR